MLSEREEEGIESLTGLASALVRRLKARVVLCRQVNDLGQVLWVGNTGSLADLEAAPDISATGPWEASSPLALEFVDEFYHCPPRPYQVWELEVRAPADDGVGALNDLLRLSRTARRDPRVAGFSVYRAPEPRNVLVAFLALGWGATPASILWNGLLPSATSERIARAAFWRPLSLICALSGLPAVQPATGPHHAILHLPFWARNPASPSPEEGSAGPGVTGRDPA